MRKFFGNFILPIYGWAGILVSALGISYIGLYEYNVIGTDLAKNAVDYILDNQTYIIIALILLVIMFLISVRLTFGMFKDKKEREPIMVNKEHGKVAITLETFENVIGLILKDMPEITNYNVLAKKDGNEAVDILVKLNLASTSNVKETIQKIQEKGIEEIEKAIDVKVKNMHFKIENIEGTKISNKALKETKKEENKKETKETK